MEKTYKIILIGESGVGKTSLINIYVNKTFSAELMPTVGCDHYIKKENINGTEYKFGIFDSAGQEQFHSIVDSYFRNVHGVLIVFDFSNRDSFEKIPFWLSKYKEKSNGNSDSAILVGNKSDLKDEVSSDETEKKGVSTEEAKEYANENGLYFYETSCKNNQGVEAAFVGLFEKVVQNIKPVSEPGPVENDNKNKCC